MLFSFNGPEEEGVTCWLSTLGLSWHSSRKVNHFDINSKNSWKLIFVFVKKKKRKKLIHMNTQPYKHSDGDQANDRSNKAFLTATTIT